MEALVDILDHKFRANMSQNLIEEDLKLWKTYSQFKTNDCFPGNWKDLERIFEGAGMDSGVTYHVCDSNNHWYVVLYKTMILLGIYFVLMIRLPSVLTVGPQSHPA